jgi:hypothetical protein
MEQSPAILSDGRLASIMPGCDSLNWSVIFCMLTKKKI